MKSMTRKHYFGIASVIVVLDRITKVAISSAIPVHRSIDVIPGFFRIAHELNEGAAFSLLAGWSSRYRSVLLIGVALVAVSVISVLLWTLSPGVRPDRFSEAGLFRNGKALALSLILGGSIGNLWDRALTGHVVDFLEFQFGHYIWPDFNVADISIVTGVCLLLAGSLFAGNSSQAGPESSSE
ncbi:MAG TPA: signal peptidase II [Candidatus Angelobacter sp.]|nr:signal peptidase II [Candidatus Angelobacter sp.]